MYRKKLSAKLFACVSLTALLSATGAQAQTEGAGVSSDETDDEILVTGSRLRSGAASEPSTVITAEDIELRGITSIEQLLRQVTANNSSVSSSNAGGINGPAPSNRGNVIENLAGGTVIDLRGLGAGSTLVLVNGRRIAGEGSANGDFIDISGIPIEAIERVEVLTAGASAIYGSDAVAGVINIILKKNYEGGSVRLRAENSSSGGDVYSASATYGFGWGSGNLTLSGSYEDQHAVSAREFGVNTLDFRSRGGGDRRRFTSRRGVFALPPFALDDADPDDPFATNVFVLPEGSGGIDEFTDPDIFDVVSRDAIGPESLVRELLPISLRPAVETYAVSARLTQDINVGIIDSLFIDAFYSKRDTKTEVESPRLELSGFDLADGFFGIPFFDDFSFSGFREDIDFSIDLADAVEAGLIPNRSFDTDSENITINGGLNFEFDEDWTLEVNGGYIENNDRERDIRAEATSVYFGLEDFDTFEFIIEPFNLVRNDFLTNDGAAAALLRTIERRLISGDSRLWTAQAIGRGAFLTGRQAGELEIAYGGELRRENISTSIDVEIADFDENVVEIPDLGASRQTLAAFGEASFPIIEDLVINGALRFEEVTNKGETVSVEDSLGEFIDTGIGQFDPIDALTNFEQSDSALTWRAGLAWTPIEDLLIRATAGKSFRAPNAFEVGEPAVTDFLFDDFIVDAATGELIDPDTAFLSGGNTSLLSETAQTFNAGFVFSPTIAEQALSIDFDYFIIDYNDRISSSGSVFNDAFNGAPLREEAIVRNPDGSIRYIFIGPINIAEQRIEGIDATFSHSAQFGAIVVDNTFSLSRQLRNDRRRISGDPIEDRLGVGQPKTRWNLSSSWNYGNVDLTAFFNFTGAYETSGGNQIDSFMTTDITASYTFPARSGLTEGLKIAAGASNIFNVDPPFFDGDNGFIAQFYDIRRRVVFVDVRKSF